MSPELVQIRRDICKDCNIVCEVRNNVDHSNPCASCPSRVWHSMGNCEDVATSGGSLKLPHTPPTSTTSHRSILHNFFSTNYICDWDGCNELHEQYEQEKTKIKGCSSCQLNGLKAKYTKLIMEKLK